MYLVHIPFWECGRDQTQGLLNLGKHCNTELSPLHPACGCGMCVCSVWCVCGVCVYACGDQRLTWGVFLDCFSTVWLFFTLTFYSLFFSYLCMCVEIWGQLVGIISLFPLMWVCQIELRSSGLTASTFTCWAFYSPSHFIFWDRASH